jgi:superfamily II DNA or RNA helicase
MDRGAEVNPRQYQASALIKIEEYALANPAGKLLVVSPPGAGKTLMEAESFRILAANHGRRALAWAHRRELAFQSYDHLIKCGVPREMMGIVVTGDAGHEGDKASGYARRVAPLAPIQVATIGMLQGRDIHADVVGSDEAHMDAAPGRRKLRERYPNALHLGFTATPCRLDGHPLDKEYDTLLEVSSVTELIALGFLAEPRVFTVPKELLPDLAKVKRRGGDFDLGEASKAANRKPIIGGIVEHWIRHAENRSTVAFGVTREHSRHIVRAFNASGIKAEHLDGEATPKERASVLARSKAGVTKVVSCCDLLSTGWDAPWIKCVILARPTESLALHIQQAWRCGRPFQGMTPIVLDHAGNCVRAGLGLPQEERNWRELWASGKPVGKGKAPSAKACEACGAICALGSTVCACGAVFAISAPSPLAPEKAGALKEIVVSQETKDQAWATILKVAADVGADEAWARKVYQSRFKDSADRS